MPWSLSVFAAGVSPGSALPTDSGQFLVHLAVDAAAVWLLAWRTFRRRHRDPDVPLVLISLNLGLFAALSTIASGEFSAGVGFGLFALLSLVRLRSEAFSSSEVAYTFICLVIALINGLPGRETWLPTLLTVLLIGVVVVVDHPRLRPTTRKLELVLDRAYSSADVARAEVTARLRTEILDVSIVSVDYVRETTRVVVRYPVEPPRRQRRPPSRAAQSATSIPGTRPADGRVTFPADSGAGGPAAGEAWPQTIGTLIDPWYGTAGSRDASPYAGAARDGAGFGPEHNGHGPGYDRFGSR